MKKLLSLPPNVVGAFHDVTNLSHEDYYCTADPVGRKLGSGGGTAWLLQSAHADEAPEKDFDGWLAQEKRILLHAGGQSRRLPAYAPSGKVLTPIPVFRWERGQCIDQTLLDLQLPLYENILTQAPAHLRTLIASGDVYLRATEPLQEIPDGADVVCYGLWASPEQATHHGVFMMNRERPAELDFMLQKPTTEEQARLMPTHLMLMDIGVWLLSDKAVARLVGKCAASDKADTEVTPQGNSLPVPACYDLYSDFGCALGAHPSRPDELLGDLKVVILPLPGGEFYHYGTSHDMIASSVAIQNLVKDQRFIIQKGVKPQTSVFTQNAKIANLPTLDTENVWIENSYLPKGFHYTKRNVVTGIPEGDWRVNLAEGQCLDMVPVGGEGAWAVRAYGFDDAMRGDVTDVSTKYLGVSVGEWLAARGIQPQELGCTADLQCAELFPVSADEAELQQLLTWFLSNKPDVKVTELWRRLPRYSAEGLSAKANLHRLFAQRRKLESLTLPALAKNWRKSVFYQVNLKNMAEKYAAGHWSLPKPLPEDAPLLTRVHDAMFRSEVLRESDDKHAAAYETDAFSLLREGLMQNVLYHKSAPRCTTFPDQIVWARSSVRIDVAGGWTDTPPYSLTAGGNVVNFAIDLNGQPPLQVYVKPCKEPVIICRSIDLGAMERIETYEELRHYNKVGSPFSIPKAALTLAGFMPGFGVESFGSLKQQLEAFGCGIEITLLAAIPAGSGLGTSSVLAATVLGAVADFCGLNWDRSEVCNRTLVLEQLLTTGGGWQDQYGGVLPGVKLLQTSPGFDQNAVARWLPDTLFTAPELRPCHLLYYTGVTRTAKNILAEIVRGMFLNNTQHLTLLNGMKQHALTVFDTMQKNDLESYGRMVRATWEQNKALDSGTNPPVIEELCHRVDDLCMGYKLPGAGGGGFMYMVAKDAEAARRIRRMLGERPLTASSRFVEMSVSQDGLQISRS